jgi:hypothetical protein
MGVAVLMLLGMVLLSALLMPAFGIPGLFYAWLTVNVLVIVTGILSLMFQKEH